ncbi:EAL domain-containing protein [Rhodoferax sp.]|uniref:EAL domain-containing protein n=1 Tax=Rhodoferax sp. TaxID=50421 RepID=UPI0025F7F73A|nr:EAL domain-containing protein [Rhodoferax sp.]
MNLPGLSCFQIRMVYRPRRWATLAGLVLSLGISAVSATESDRSFLTQQERSWIATHAGQVRVAPEGNFPPFSFIESGKWQGLSADMVQMLNDRIGVQFQILPAQNLDAILADAQRAKVEIVTSLSQTPERSQYLHFTQPYFRVPTAIIVKADFIAGQWPDAFLNKRVAVGKGYGVQKFLENNFPAIQLALVADDLDGMRKLSFGEVDAVIMDVASASFFIEREKFTNLRMLAAFDYTYDLSFGVRKDLPVLHVILSKTLASIPDRDRQAMLDKWISISPDPLSLIWGRIRPWLPWLAAIFALLIAAGIMAWRIQRHRRNVERRLAQYARSLIEASLDPLVAISSEGKITDLNAATERVTGRERTDLVGSDFADYFTDPALAREGYREAFAKGFVTDHPLAIRHTSGKITDVLYNASVYRDPEGRVMGVFAAARDVTEKKRADSLVQAASVFSYAREGIMITEADGTILNVNDAFTRITGYGREEALGKNPRLLNSGRQDEKFYAAMWADLNDKGHWYGELWNRRKNGSLFLEALTITAVRSADGSIEHYVALFADITEVREHQRQLEHMAHFDALTNLPNRLLLSDRLDQGLAHTERRGNTLAVAYLDLDGFKAINDQHGHEAGDQLLVAIAERMKQTLREGDTLARLGGDEFVAVMGDLTDVDVSLPLLDRLLAAAAQAVVIGDQSLQVSASIGVAFYPQTQAVDADQLLRQADQAMYQAKLEGKNRYHIFDAQHDSNIRVQNEGLERIRRALSDHEFLLYFQPKVNMRIGKVIGAEALIRWQHPERGLLGPALFLPAIEGHPLAVAVGEWVIDTALAQVESWRKAGLDIPVSVNVGARQLQQVDFVERLRAILAAHPQVSPSCLELEILETTALEDIAQVSKLIESCAQLGVSFALDDFGTGYSSLTYLKRLQVRMLKIDQSFVRDMLEDPDDLAILQGVISLAAAFKREVIAEGVETVEHGSLLLQMGCDLAQGYGIARPMPARELPAWVMAWRAEPDWLKKKPPEGGL